MGAAQSPAPAQADGISVTEAWARATAATGNTGAVYVTVTDTGDPDQLTGASTPVAATAELHQTVNSGGIMKMLPVASLPLKPGEPVTFTPGGYHVMLKRGDSFPLTLTFAHARPVTVQVSVAGPGAMEPMAAMPAMQDMPGMGTKGSQKQ
jgi:copper(I)-binding protein